jgi:DsbC/DsbD-like thiol-disulfide interchange protein
VLFIFPLIVRQKAWGFSIAPRENKISMKRTIFILFPLLLGAVTLSWSQAENPIRWSASVVRSRPFYHPGQNLTVVLKADIDAGWHLYSFPQPPDSPVFPAFIIVPKGQAFALAGEIERPAAESAMDPNFGVETSFYEDSVAFRIPLRVAARLHPGKQKLTLQVRYQTCNDRKCLPPKTETIETSIKIREDSAQKAGPNPEEARPVCQLHHPERQPLLLRRHTDFLTCNL